MKIDIHNQEIAGYTLYRAKDVYEGMEHKFIIPLKDIEGTCLHPDYDWSIRPKLCADFDFDEEDDED